MFGFILARKPRRIRTRTSRIQRKIPRESGNLSLSLSVSFNVDKIEAQARAWRLLVLSSKVEKKPHETCLAGLDQSIRKEKANSLVSFSILAPSQRTSKYFIPVCICSSVIVERRLWRTRRVKTNAHAERPLLTALIVDRSNARRREEVELALSSSSRSSSGSSRESYDLSRRFVGSFLARAIGFSRRSRFLAAIFSDQSARRRRSVSHART